MTETMSIARRITRSPRTGFFLFALGCALLANGCQVLRHRPGDSFDEEVVWTRSPDAACSDVLQTAAKTESAEVETLPAPRPAEPTDTIDLAAAFQLAGIDNPTINLAREAVREALGRQQAANVLLLPDVNVGGSVNVHRGTLQSTSGFIREVNRQSAYAGMGARALGGSTVAVPGLFLSAHLGNAIFEPLAARQHVEARRSQSTATENQTLLAVAAAYFELLGAELRVEALRLGEAEIAPIVRLTTSYAKAGQGRAADQHRAEANAAFVRRQLEEAQGELAAASARVTRLLSLDPSTHLRTPPGPVPAVRLIDETVPLEDLVQRAVQNRPEIRARLQELAEARTRIKQERTRPLLPLVGVGFSGGTFGGGSNLSAAGITQPGGEVVAGSRFGNFGGRVDFDVAAIWTLQNAGAGNVARSHAALAVAGEASAQVQRAVNDVRREVADAQAEANRVREQLEIVRGQLSIAEEGYRQEMTRIRNTVGRPIETLDSFNQLLESQLEIRRLTVAYNVAQYRLFVAVGMSPLEGGAACP